MQGAENPAAPLKTPTQRHPLPPHRRNVPGFDMAITADLLGQFGKGRVLAYTSDPAPHWGCNFVFWQQYPKFWTNAARWLTSVPAKP